jgi:hypothetical protein
MAKMTTMVVPAMMDRLFDAVHLTNQLSYRRSPAVRDYLGLSETDVTDWRFVEFSEVSRGPWSRLGENNTFVISDRKTSRELAEASRR